MLSLFTVVDLHVAVNNMKTLCVANGTQEWLLPALLSK
jgi:hypothetical protein